MSVYQQCALYVQLSSRVIYHKPTAYYFVQPRFHLGIRRLKQVILNKDKSQTQKKLLALERYFKMHFLHQFIIKPISYYLFNNDRPNGGKQHCIPTILIKHGCK